MVMVDEVIVETEGLTEEVEYRGWRTRDLESNPRDAEARASCGAAP